MYINHRGMLLQPFVRNRGGGGGGAVAIGVAKESSVSSSSLPSFLSPLRFLSVAAPLSRPTMRSTVAYISESGICGRGIKECVEKRGP